MANKFRKFEIGSKVRYTGKHLKSTGQGRGSAGLSVWTIMGFAMGGRWAIVDEPVSDLSMFTAEELADDPTLAYRRISLEALCIVGQIDSRNCV